MPLFAAILLLIGNTSSANDADKFFADQGPLPVFKFTVEPANVEQLRRDPDKNVQCKVVVGDKTFADVSMHLKGAAGSFRDWDDKPAMTIEFNKTQLFHGLAKIHLNNSVQDPRYMTEILCGRMMLAAGVPTARATHALVELNGRKTGLYVLKEGYDGAFLRRHFGSSNGNLYDGGFLTDIDGELKRSHGSDDVEGRSDLRAAAAAAREPDRAARFAKVDKLVDVDRFINMIAVENLTWHWDGYAMKKNNYRIYHDLKSGKLVFMPHGMDQMWWDPDGPIHPGFQGLMARKLMETGEGRDRYRKALAANLDKVHKSSELHKQIDVMLTRLKAHLEPIDPGLYQAITAEAAGLKQAITAREQSVRKQLAP